MYYGNKEFKQRFYGKSIGRCRLERTFGRLCLERVTVGKIQGQGGIENGFHA